MEHAADDLRGAAEFSVDRALAHGTNGRRLQDVEEVEAGGGQAEGEERFAGDADASPVGAFEAEEYRVRRRGG